MPVSRPASPAEVRPLPDGSLHFVGIGGAGQSAIAYVLAARGRVVRGSDPGISGASKTRLESVGCEIFTQHTAENLAPDTAALIATDAVNEQNPEVAEALRRGIPVFRRPEALANLVNSAKVAICVAGTHGKTTTTGMITSILLAAGLNPTVLIGGELPQIGGNARNGDPDLVVAEACEAYGGLDCLRPTIAVITNCEPDHLDFHGTEENFYAAFARFISHAKSPLLCSEIPNETAEKILGDRYGTTGSFGFSGGIWTPDLNTSTFRLKGYPGTADSASDISLPIPGTHNVLNALGAAAAAERLCLPLAPVKVGLESFTGTGRRFERLGEVSGITIVDDYAHHPTEIRATLQAARQAFPERRLIAVYQPHLPSRTRDFLDGFAEALSQADVLYLTDIYLAREPEQPGLIEALIERIGQPSPLRPSPASYLSAPSSPIARKLAGRGSEQEFQLGPPSQGGTTDEPKGVPSGARRGMYPNEERVQGEEGRRLSGGEMERGERIHLVKNRHELPMRLLPELRHGDVVLFMGAGNIREQAEELLKML